MRERQRQNCSNSTPKRLKNNRLACFARGTTTLRFYVTQTRWIGLLGVVAVLPFVIKGET